MVGHQAHHSLSRWTYSTSLEHTRIQNTYITSLVQPNNICISRLHRII